MKYRYFDDECTADIGFTATGDTAEEMMVAAAEATMKVMVENSEDIAGTITKTIKLEVPSLEMALFDLLGELIFFKDAEELLLRLKDVTLTRDAEGFKVGATAYGEQIDRKRHQLLVDVKAVTLHRFKVEKSTDGWTATVVLDI